MKVPTRCLPDCIKKRLEFGTDATVGTEYVTALIVNWGKKLMLQKLMYFEL